MKQSIKNKRVDIKDVVDTGDESVDVGKDKESDNTARSISDELVWWSIAISKSDNEKLMTENYGDFRFISDTVLYSIYTLSFFFNNI